MCVCVYLCVCVLVLPGVGRASCAPVHRALHRPLCAPSPTAAATKVWTNVIGPSQERPGVRASGSACVVPGNRMLVFGGYDGSEFLQDLWVLHTGMWPPDRRVGCQPARACLYLCGRA
jgi:hypothetical protein